MPHPISSRSFVSSRVPVATVSRILGLSWVRCVLLALGLGCYYAFFPLNIWSSSLTVTLGSEVVLQSEIYTLCLAVTLIVIGILARSGQGEVCATRFATVLSFGLLAGSIGVFWLGTSWRGGWWMPLAIVLLAGIGSASPYVVWQRAALALQRECGAPVCAMTLALSFAPTVLYYLVRQFMDVAPQAAIGLGAMLLAISAVCTVVLAGPWTTEPIAVRNAGGAVVLHRGVRPILWALAFVWMLSVAIPAVIRELPHAGVAAEPGLGILVSHLVAIVLIIGSCFVAARRQVSFGRLARPVLTVLAVQLLCVPMLVSLSWTAAIALCTGVHVGLIVFTMLLINSLAQGCKIAIVQAMRLVYDRYLVALAVWIFVLPLLLMLVGPMPVLVGLPCLCILPLVIAPTQMGSGFCDTVPASDSQKSSSEKRCHQVAEALASRGKLTAREIQVLELLLTGSSREEVATELCISIWTVKNHTNNIYAKLGVHSLRDLVALANELAKSMADTHRDSRFV